MTRKPPTRKVLFPTKVALLLVLPSLALYLFFNIWPMLFSIGVAFTDATRYNILPSPEKIQDLRNSIACAEYLKTSTQHRENALAIVRNLDETFNIVKESFRGIKGILDTGRARDEITPYALNLTTASRIIKRVRGRIGEVFNCVMFGYPTTLELIPKGILEDLDSLLTVISRVAGSYLYLEHHILYKDVVDGLNLTVKLREFFYKLEVDYEGYMDKYIESAVKELDKLGLKFIGVGNFQRLSTDPRFYNSLYKTLLFVATSVPLKVSVGVLLALLYSTPLIYGKRALRTLLLVPWAMPFLLSAITWKFLLLPNGQLGGALGININVNEWHAFLSYNFFEAWLAYPFIMTVTQGALSGLSRDVIEAALVDGASLRERLFKVVFPLIAKPVTLASILTTGHLYKHF